MNYLWIISDYKRFNLVIKTSSMCYIVIQVVFTFKSFTVFCKIQIINIIIFTMPSITQGSAFYFNSISNQQKWFMFVFRLLEHCKFCKSM